MTTDRQARVYGAANGFVTALCPGNGSLRGLACFDPAGACRPQRKRHSRLRVRSPADVRHIGRLVSSEATGKLLGEALGEHDRREVRERRWTVGHD